MTRAEPDTPPTAKRAPEQRSRVGNGRLLLPMTDRRSASYRRLQDLVEDISRDLGGAEHLNESQRTLVKMAATLTAECERMAAAAMNGEKDLDAALYGTLVDRVGRLLQRLGLSTLARNVGNGNGRDVRSLAALFAKAPEGDDLG